MAFEEHEADATEVLAEERLIVDVDGFEGPLDLLLELARRQKVDLHKISVLALAEQYLAFVEAARRVRLELAADYLVMAAWLAYLKSRLLLPRAERPEEPEAGALAAALAERLRRLEVIRAAAQALEARPSLGRDLALRGRARRCGAGGRPTPLRRDDLRLDDGLCPAAAEAGAVAREAEEAGGLVADRGARGPGTPRRHRRRLERTRRLPPRLLRRPFDAPHRARLGVLDHARDGQGGKPGAAPGSRLRAALGESGRVVGNERRDRPPLSRCRAEARRRRRAAPGGGGAHRRGPAVRRTRADAGGRHRAAPARRRRGHGGPGEAQGRLRGPRRSARTGRRQMGVSHRRRFGLGCSRRADAK